MTSVETAPAVRSPSRRVTRGATALPEAAPDADADAEPVAAGFTVLSRNARRPAQAGHREPVSAAVLAPVKLPTRMRSPSSVAGPSTYTGKDQSRHFVKHSTGKQVRA